MADQTISVQGLKELNQKLYALRDKVAENAVRRATYGASKVIRDRMRSRAPVGKDSPSPGELKKSINIRTKVIRREGKVVASIGPKRTKRDVTRTVKGEKVKVRRNRRDAVPRSEARWLEFGVQPHEIGKGKNIAFGGKIVHGPVKHPGFAPKPFIAESGERAFPGAVNEFKTVLKQEIDKAAK